MKTRKPIRFRSPKIMYSDGSPFYRFGEFLKKLMLSVYQRLRAIIVAILLIFTSILFGVFSYRLFNLTNFSLNSAFDSVFNQKLPASSLIIGSLIVALTYGLFFFTSNSKNQFKITVAPFTKFIAVVSVIIGFDLFYLQINLSNFNNVNFIFHGNMEFFAIQISTLIVIMFLWIFYPKLAPISTPSPISTRIPEKINSIYGISRFLLVTILIIWFSVHLSTEFFYTVDNQKTAMQISWLTYPKLGAILAACFVSAITYWPPTFRRIKNKLGLLRFITALASLIGAGLIYRLMEDPIKYLIGFVGAFILAIIFIPLQRVLS